MVAYACNFRTWDAESVTQWDLISKNKSNKSSCKELVLRLLLLYENHLQNQKLYSDRRIQLRIWAVDSTNFFSIWCDLYTFILHKFRNSYANNWCIFNLNCNHSHALLPLNKTGIVEQLYSMPHQCLLCFATLFSWKPFYCLLSFDVQWMPQEKLPALWLVHVVIYGALDTGKSVYLNEYIQHGFAYLIIDNMYLMRKKWHGKNWVSNYMSP